MVKKQAKQERKIKAAIKDFIAASYFFQQYHSPRCWRTAKEAMDNFEKLRTKKDKFKFVKEQILIRYLGLGWEETYHPWSEKGHTYQPLELLEHVIHNVQTIKKNCHRNLQSAFLVGKTMAQLVPTCPISLHLTIISWPRVLKQTVKHITGVVSNYGYWEFHSQLSSK